MRTADRSPAGGARYRDGICEQIWPAESRPVLARGHVQDACFVALHAIVVIPLMTLLSVGAAALLSSHAQWIELRATEHWPGWLLIPHAFQELRNVASFVETSAPNIGCRSSDGEYLLAGTSRPSASAIARMWCGPAPQQMPT
jgi:hypothetical protein